MDIPPEDPRARTTRPIPPVPIVSPAVLARYGAKVLDPLTAVRKPGQRLNPTVYLADHLLVHGLPSRSAGERVAEMQKRELANESGVQLTISAKDTELDRQMVTDQNVDVLDQTWTTRVHLTHAGDVPGAPVDAWEMLQQIRYEERENLVGQVALDHLMTAGSEWAGVGGMWGGVGGMWGGVGGMWGGVGGMWGGVGGGLAMYGAPGFGGRTPVVWSAPDPRENAPEPVREPVVAILDTGIGRHPWFQPDAGGFIEQLTDLNNQPIGVQLTAAFDPEYVGVVTDPLNGLIDNQAGHGTFIAGIVRQRCPQAFLLAIPVMAADGTVTEHDVITALNQLLALHLTQRVPHGGTLDVVSLSMGYYHETPEDPTAGGPLHEVLQAYADAGIAVVAAAGNAATSAEFFPAALSQKVAGGVPLTSVGALNPDQRTVALFSNNGTWVTTHAPGAGVVSTVPVTLTGGYGRGILVNRDDPLPRSTVDPDDYRSGFAIWSGTSFAAPWVAGEIAAGVAKSGDVATSVQDVLKDRQSRFEAIRAGGGR